MSPLLLLLVLVALGGETLAQQVISTPIALTLPSVPQAAASDADLEFAFSGGQLQFQDMCSKLSSPASKTNFGCSPLDSAAAIQAIWKRNNQDSIWEALSSIDQAALGEKQTKSTMESIVEDALGSAAKQDGERLSLHGNVASTGRFLLACSRLPGCLSSALTQEERAGFASFLLSQPKLTPEVALGLKALQDFGLVSVVVKHLAGEELVQVEAKTLLGSPLAWRLGPKTSSLVKVSSPTQITVNKKKLSKSLSTVELEIVVDNGASKLVELSFPLAQVELENLSLVIKDKGVLVDQQDPVMLEKNQVLELAFRLTGALCPEQAVLALVHSVSKQDVQFPLTCSGDNAGGPKLVLANTQALSEELDFVPGPYDMVLVVSDDKMAKPVKRALGTIKVLPFERTVKKELPLFATSLLHESDTTRTALPEIHHQFREPDRRAPKLFALVFTAVQVALLLGLVVVFQTHNHFHVLKMLSSPRLAFFAAVLTTIEVVFVWYWVGVAGAPNMENLTYKYLPPLLVVLTIASKAVMTPPTAVGVTGKKQTASM
ncbi:hypothetical protein BASA81_001551 [Batrachochytrium salamandrivorans]|nr:hypothetical protein BASA81_001551 [Batrachochytrium salamandrivorans]